MNDQNWMTAIGDFVNRVGFPAAVAIILGVGIWSIIRWFKPWGEKLFDAHIQFTQSLGETQKKQAITQGDTLRLLDELQGLHKGSRKALGHIAEAVQEATPEERRPAVRIHVQKAHEALNDD